MSKEIVIPFNDWSRDRLCSGDKSATTRNKRYGEIGDYFEVDVGSEINTYEVLAVFPMILDDVARYLYHFEGAKNPKEFKQIWCDIHKRAGWEPDRIVFVHLFFKV